MDATPAPVAPEARAAIRADEIRLAFKSAHGDTRFLHNSVADDKMRVDMARRALEYARGMLRNVVSCADLPETRDVIDTDCVGMIEDQIAALERHKQTLEAV